MTATPEPASPFSPPPGARLREAHAHIASLGQSLELGSLESCTSLRQCLETVAAAARNAPTDAGQRGRPWVRLHSARPQAWTEARWPTLAELDRASGEACVVVMSFDHHAAAANTQAMDAAGLHAGVSVPPNGVVEVDAAGTATGLLLEQAAHAAWNAAPQPSPHARRGHVLAALEVLHALGYTEVHDLLSQAWLGPLLADLAREGLLRQRVWLYPPIDRLAADAAQRAAWESDQVRLAGGKVFADGTLNSRTACMIHRYAEPLVNVPRGQCMVAPRALDEQFRAADALGLPLAVHAIGDNAVRTVLDSIERVRPRAPGQRIEHCEFIDAADVPRFAKLGVICSVQPCHLLTDVEAITRFVPHRAERVLPLRELIDAGCRPGELLWFGSDVPIVRANPEDSVRAAVSRRRAGVPEAEAIAPRQAISEREAWACFGAAADHPRGGGR
ncbi:MAG: amidohydrolase [Phycisphaerales bacterium]